MHHGDMNDETVRALSIVEAARAAGSDRHLIRRKLQDGELPNAFKDAQGIWRIPHDDLARAGLLCTDPDELVLIDVPDEALSAPTVDELARLRLELLEQRLRAERAEALLEAERRICAETAKTLEVERRALEALALQLTGQQNEPSRPEPSRVGWQAGLRAARARDLEQRAERDRTKQPVRGAEAASAAPAPDSEPEQPLPLLRPPEPVADIAPEDDPTRFNDSFELPSGRTGRARRWRKR
jgi:hypothetical protein